MESLLIAESLLHLMWLNTPNLYMFKHAHCHSDGLHHTLFFNVNEKKKMEVKEMHYSVKSNITTILRLPSCLKTKLLTQVFTHKNTRNVSERYIILTQHILHAAPIIQSNEISSHKIYNRMVTMEHPWLEDKLLLVAMFFQHTIKSLI